jgi:hypothetical protein
MAEISLRELWRESLAPFKNNNLKLYLLGTLATGIRAIKTLLGTVWWLLPLLIGVALSITYLARLVIQNSYAMALIGGLFLIVATISFILIWYLIILATRPSLEPKSCDYFTTYFRGWWSIFLLMLFVPGSNLATITALPLITTIILFFLDTDLSLDAFAASFVRGVKALVYFLPGLVTIFFAGALCLLSCVTITLGTNWLISWVLHQFIDHTHRIATFFTFLFTTTLITCIAASVAIFFAAALTTYYVKIKHEHHDLFFI